MSFKKGTGKQLIQIGLFQTFLQYICFYIGMSYSSGIEGAIISGTSSFFQILLAHFLYKDDALNMRKIIGVSIGFCGVVLVNVPSDGSLSFHFGIGSLLLLSAAMLYSYGNILAKEGSKTLDVGYMTAYQMMFGSIGLLCIGALQVGVMPFTFSLHALLMLIYLSFLSAAGFCIWNTIMKYNKVGKVSMYMFFIPVFGVLLSSMILGEAIHSFVLLGLACVAAGIIVVNRTPAKQKIEQEKTSSIESRKSDYNGRTVLFFFFYRKKDNRLSVTKKRYKKHLLRRTYYESTLRGVNWANTSFFNWCNLCNAADKKNER